MNTLSSVLNRGIRSAVLASLLCVALADQCLAQAVKFGDSLGKLPAALMPQPTHGLLLGAARAGNRVVAVGDRGLVIYSDDDGKTYKQAKYVPTRATLTAVWAADARHVFAVGHWGVILASLDAGETWSLQRSDFKVDQPLLTVWFRDARHGVAAGLFSLLLVTQDGGTTWQPTHLPAPPGAKGDLNLYRLFPGAGDDVWIAAEQGMAYSSSDFGQTWHLHITGAKGTLWAGVVLRDGSVVVGGVSGHVMRSTDSGATWRESDSGVKSSITDLIELPSGSVLGVALNGVSLLSDDGGIVFKSRQLVDQRSLTAVAVTRTGSPLIFSQSGVVHESVIP